MKKTDSVDLTDGVEFKTILSIGDIVAIEKASKMLRHMLNINGQILNDILVNNHPLIGTFLQNYIVHHNNQVKAYMLFQGEVEDMYYNLLVGGEE
mgnify:FL=1